MGTSQRIRSEAPVLQRRRGSVLERAILDAALDQLGAVGWGGMTMEGVAARAQTGKAAVYRRWPSKEALVADALRLGLPQIGAPPDLGTLREDLLCLVMRMRESMYSQGGIALRAVLDECDHAAAQPFVELIVQGVIEPGKQLILDVVRRGITRGTVRADATAAIVADVAPALMMFRAKLGDHQIREEDVVDLVDHVMLPLLRP
ncbi:TetR/AcrR family transcriptional regulator [Streptomyces sp. SPB162]|uniref:TetR/AcrR family transcriptional regulator n=1 Tax=Streptomyces sp. SPB162 TaxID=2940560 RepID=UPI002404EC17|nr:TetR/AcrR family transcriptional regulator [Streptomyces sp. SPB162]MDF9816090.1 AcrR family transcriptional regulator [Streptomyces sp. SPB162]